MAVTHVVMPSEVAEEIVKPKETGKSESPRSETRFINFRTAAPIPALTGVILRTVSPVKGECTSLTLHFPAGCNSLVLIRVKIGDTWEPLAGWIALNDATPVYAVSYPVRKTSPLEVEIWNTDLQFAHHPSVILALQGEP